MFLQKELFSHCAAFFWDVLYVQSRHNALCTWCPSYDKRRLNFLPLTLSPIQPKNCPENNWEISSKLQVSLLTLNQRIKSTIAEKQVNRKLKKKCFFLGFQNWGFGIRDQKWYSLHLSKPKISQHQKLPFLKRCIILFYDFMYRLVIVLSQKKLN